MADEQLTFGQFSGAYVSEVPSYYLHWLIRKAYDTRVRQSAIDEWDHRSRMNSHWLMPKLKRFS